MITSVLTNLRMSLLRGGYYLALLSVVLRTVHAYADEPDLPVATKLLAIALILAFSALSIGRHAHLPALANTTVFLAVQTVIATVLLLLPPGLDYITLLYLLLTIEAMLALPKRTSYGWVALFAALTVVTLVVEFEPGEAAIYILVYTGAYFFFGSLASAVVESEAARKRAATLLSELTASEERFRSLVTGSPDSIFLFDPEYKLVDVNPRACEMLGYTRSELLALTPDQIDAGYKDGDATRLTEALKDPEQALPMERSFLRRSDSSEVPVEITLAVIELGGVRHALAVARDVTERIEAQDALFRQTREVAVLEERNRMAREIHDTLAQGFTGIVLQLEAAEQALEERPEGAGAHLARAKNLARESLQEARRSVLNLVPRALEDKTLSQAIEQEVTEFASHGRESASFSASGEARPLHREAQLALLRIRQESLTNVRRHAEATRVEVQLEFETDAVSLTIDDDGKGIQEGVSGGGFGLVGMQERARLLGGEFSAQRRDGGGTRVRVGLPLGSDA